VHASVSDSVGAIVHASVHASVSDSVGAIVHASVRDSVDASVGASVSDSVRDSVDASVGAIVHASVGDSVRDSVGDSAGASVSASVDASVGAIVHASVRDSVDASVRDSVWSADPKIIVAYRSVISSTWHRRMGGQFWVGWGWGWWSSPSMLSFFRDVCGLDFGEKSEIVDAIIALGESCCWWWPHKEFVMVCERPQVLERDEAGRLHSVSGAACGWGDGWGVYAVHGTRVPSWIIEHPDRLTVDAIHAERNAEVRRVMVDRYGLARYVRDAQFEVLDADTDPLGQPRRLLRRADIVVVELTNSTVDADGMRRVYHVACEPSLRPLLADGELGEPQALTALNAVAASYGMRGEQYVLEVET
jgi:hypothetical protein